MPDKCKDKMLEAIKLSEQLIHLARTGGAECGEDSCQILYSIILDRALTIHSASEKELKRTNHGHHAA